MQVWDDFVDEFHSDHAFGKAYLFTSELLRAEPCYFEKKLLDALGNPAGVIGMRLQCEEMDTGGIEESPDCSAVEVAALTRVLWILGVPKDLTIHIIRIITRVISPRDTVEHLGPVQTYVAVHLCEHFWLAEIFSHWKAYLLTQRQRKTAARQKFEQEQYAKNNRWDARVRKLQEESASHDVADDIRRYLEANTMSLSAEENLRLARDFARRMKPPVADPEKAASLVAKFQGLDPPDGVLAGGQVRHARDIVAELLAIFEREALYFLEVQSEVAEVLRRAQAEQAGGDPSTATGDGEGRGYGAVWTAIRKRSVKDGRTLEEAHAEFLASKKFKITKHIRQAAADLWSLLCTSRQRHVRREVGLLIQQVVQMERTRMDEQAAAEKRRIRILGEKAELRTQEMRSAQDRAVNACMSWLVLHEERVLPATRDELVQLISHFRDNLAREEAGFQEREEVLAQIRTLKDAEVLRLGEIAKLGALAQRKSMTPAEASAASARLLALFRSRSQRSGMELTDELGADRIIEVPDSILEEDLEALADVLLREAQLGKANGEIGGPDAFPEVRPGQTDGGQLSIANRPAKRKKKKKTDSSKAKVSEEASLSKGLRTSGYLSTKKVPAGRNKGPKAVDDGPLAVESAASGAADLSEKQYTSQVVDISEAIQAEIPQYTSEQIGITSHPVADETTEIEGLDKSNLESGFNLDVDDRTASCTVTIQDLQGSTSTVAVSSILPNDSQDSPCIPGNSHKPAVVLIEMTTVSETNITSSSQFPQRPVDKQGLFASERDSQIEKLDTPKYNPVAGGDPTIKNEELPVGEAEQDVNQQIPLLKPTAHVPDAQRSAAHESLQEMPKDVVRVSETRDSALEGILKGDTTAAPKRISEEPLKSSESTKQPVLESVELPSSPHDKLNHANAKQKIQVSFGEEELLAPKSAGISGIPQSEFLQFTPRPEIEENDYERDESEQSTSDYSGTSSSESYESDDTDNVDWLILEEGLQNFSKRAFVKPAFLQSRSFTTGSTKSKALFPPLREVRDKLEMSVCQGFRLRINTGQRTKSMESPESEPLLGNERNSLFDDFNGSDEEDQQYEEFLRFQAAAKSAGMDSWFANQAYSHEGKIDVPAHQHVREYPTLNRHSHSERGQLSESELFLLSQNAYRRYLKARTGIHFEGALTDHSSRRILPFKFVTYDVDDDLLLAQNVVKNRVTLVWKHPWLNLHTSEADNEGILDLYARDAEDRKSSKVFKLHLDTWDKFRQLRANILSLKMQKSSQALFFPLGEPDFVKHSTEILVQPSRFGYNFEKYLSVLALYSQNHVAAEANQAPLFITQLHPDKNAASLSVSRGSLVSRPSLIKKIRFLQSVFRRKLAKKMMRKLIERGAVELFCQNIIMNLVERISSAQEAADLILVSMAQDLLPQHTSNLILNSLPLNALDSSIGLDVESIVNIASARQHELEARQLLRIETQRIQSSIEDSKKQLRKRAGYVPRKIAQTSDYDQLALICRIPRKDREHNLQSAPSPFSPRRRWIVGQQSEYFVENEGRSMPTEAPSLGRGRSIPAVELTKALKRSHGHVYRQPQQTTQMTGAYASGAVVPRLSQNPPKYDPFKSAKVDMI